MSNIQPDNIIVLMKVHTELHNEKHFQLVTFKEATGKFKLKIELLENKSYRLQSGNFGSSILATVGDYLDLRLVKVHFLENMPLGLFDKTNFGHLTTLVEATEKASKEQFGT